MTTPLSAALLALAASVNQMRSAMVNSLHADQHAAIDDAIAQVKAYADSDMQQAEATIGAQATAAVDAALAAAGVGNYATKDDISGVTARIAALETKEADDVANVQGQITDLADGLTSATSAISDANTTDPEGSPASPPPPPPSPAPTGTGTATGATAADTSGTSGGAATGSETGATDATAAATATGTPADGSAPDATATQDAATGAGAAS